MTVRYSPSLKRLIPLVTALCAQELSVCTRGTDQVDSDRLSDIMLCVSVLCPSFSLAPAAAPTRRTATAARNTVMMPLERKFWESPPPAVLETTGPSVPAVCKFMADPSLDSVSVADKKAFLASKGVDEFVIAQAECVAPEDNVQGHPELPAAAEKELVAA